MFLSPVCQHEVINEINRLALSKMSGIDNVPSNIVKLYCNFIYKPLAYMCNLTFSVNTVPQALKVSKVIPVFKKGARLLPGNYRPISLMSVFNEILEQLMLKRLVDFLHSSNVLSKHQFGFRKYHSTTLTIIKIIQDIRKSLDNDNLVMGIYLDLSKAFDTVNHGILWHKLDHCGIRGYVCKWFLNY